MSSDDVFQETSTRYRAVEPEQWLQRHPEAGSSWPSWSKASQVMRLQGYEDLRSAAHFPITPAYRVTKWVRVVLLKNEYRGTSLIRKRLPLGPYSRPMRRVLSWS